VLVFGQSTGLWTKAIEIDGRNANTAGSRGVRTVHFDKVRVADCSSNNQYVHIRQGTHISGNIQIDTGNGTGTMGMTIDDNWDHINLHVRAGNVIVNYTGSDNPDIWLGGSCDTLDINSASVIGTCPIKATNGITVAGKLVAVSSWIADRFQANLSATVGNVTGDGTSYTILYDNESFDRNSTYDPSTGIATIKCGGLYAFTWGVVLTGLGAAHTTGELQLIHRNSGATLIATYSHKYGVGPMRDAGNQCGIKDSILVECSEGDTLRVNIIVSGSTKTVGVGGASTRYSCFSGKHVA
jgi:hypothetical protein